MGPRIAVSAVFALGTVHLIFVLNTFKAYGGGNLRKKVSAKEGERAGPFPSGLGQVLLGAAAAGRGTPSNGEARFERAPYSDDDVLPDLEKGDRNASRASVHSA